MEKGELNDGVVAESEVDAGRRSAMRKIAVSVGVLATYSVLPESWTRPIIGQIVVPVHAATSGSSLHDPCAVDQRSGDQKSETIMIKVTGFVTPPVGNLPVIIVATAVGGANQRVEGHTTTYPDGTFEAYLTVGGGPGITSIGVTTTVTGADGSANCSVNITTNAPANGPARSFRDVVYFGEGEESTVCLTIAGTTATFFAFDPDQVANPGKYISGSGPVGTKLTGVDGDTTVDVTILGSVTGDVLQISIRSFNNISNVTYLDDNVNLPLVSGSCL